MARRPFFSGNYGSALGSTANAANLIAQAGATQGQMYANLGAQIGNMIQQYGLNKEKREAEERTAMGNLASFSPQELMEMKSRDPKLSKAIDNMQSDKASPKDFQLFNASSAPYAAGKSRRLQEENAQIRNSLNKLQLNVAEYLNVPQIRDAIDSYKLDQQLRDSRRKTLPFEATERESRLAASHAQNKKAQELTPGEIELALKEQRKQSKQLDVINKYLNKVGTDHLAEVEVEKTRIAMQQAKANLDRTKSLTKATKAQIALLKQPTINPSIPGNVDVNKKISDVTKQIEFILNSPAMVTDDDGDPLKIEDLIEDVSLSGEIKFSEDANRMADRDRLRLQNLFIKKLELQGQAKTRYIDGNGNIVEVTIDEYEELLRQQLEEEQKQRQASREANEMELRRNVLLGPGAGLKY